MLAFNPRWLLRCLVTITIALLAVTVMAQPEPTPPDRDLLAENYALRGQLALAEGRFSEGMLLAQLAGPAYWEPVRQAKPSFIRLLRWHTGSVTAVAYHPDGTLLASGGSDGFIYLWSQTEAALYPPFALSEPGGPVLALAFSPDGSLLASAHESGVIVLWESSSGGLVARLTGHTTSVQALAFSPAGDVLASAALDGSVRLWDIPNRVPIGEPLLNQDATVGYYSLAFSPDGYALAGGDGSGGISLWQTESRERIARLDDHRDRVTAVAFTPDGKQMVSAGLDGRLNLWDLRERRVASSVENLGPLTALSLNATGEVLTAVSDRLHFWRLQDRRFQIGLEETAPEGLSLSGIDLNPVADVVAVGAGDAVLLWNPVSIVRPIELSPCDVAGRNPTAQEFFSQEALQVGFAPGVSMNWPCGQFRPHYSVVVQWLETATHAEAEEARSLFAQIIDQGLGWPALDLAVCRSGVRAGFAVEVFPACESAVMGAPDNTLHRDARGLVRALTGNLEGAIADFSTFVSWARTVGYDPEAVALREGWVTALRAGQNPITLPIVDGLP
jgi:WD40 repeat protein